MSTFEEVSRTLDSVMHQFITDRNRKTGEAPTDIAINVGRALIMNGGTWLGRALEIKDPDEGMRPAKECLERYQKMADVM